MPELSKLLYLASKSENPQGQRLMAQLQEDIRLDKYTPDLDEEYHETIPTVGTINVGKRVYRGLETILFEATTPGIQISESTDVESDSGDDEGSSSRPMTSHQESGEWLIKYQVNYDQSESFVHPLIRDYWYSSDASKLGLAPQPLFLSPPAGLPKNPTRKTSFALSGEMRLFCRATKRNVRFMVTERLIGESLDTFRRRFSEYRAPLAAALELGVMIVDGLKRLHAIDIAHGDIHAGNIFVEFKPNSTSGDIDFGTKFIDFGRAFKVDKGMLSNRKIYPRGKFSSYLYSHWIIEGYLQGKRDDLLRAVQAIATISNGVSLQQFEQNLEKHSMDELIEWKKTGFWFEPPYSLSPIDALDVTEEIKAEVKEILLRVMDLIRDCNDITKPLPYDEVISLFQLATRLINGDEELKVVTSTTTEPDINQKANIEDLGYYGIDQSTDFDLQSIKIQP